MRPVISDSLISGQPLNLLYWYSNRGSPAAADAFFAARAVTATGSVRLQVTGRTAHLQGFALVAGTGPEPDREARCQRGLEQLSARSSRVVHGVRGASIRTWKSSSAAHHAGACPINCRPARRTWSRANPMSIRVVRLGSARAKGEGVRIGRCGARHAACRSRSTPRRTGTTSGSRTSRPARDHEARARRGDRGRVGRFTSVPRGDGDTREPACDRTARGASHASNFAIGCYCADESAATGPCCASCCARAERNP
jgi:hypothetical protein